MDIVNFADRVMADLKTKVTSLMKDYQECLEFSKGNNTSDIVKLNVSGNLMQVSRKLLTKINGSHMKNQFSGEIPLEQDN